MSTEQRNKHDAPDLKIATWNVLTLLQAGKMQEVANQMIKNQLDIIALQEIRWQGQGKIDKKDFSLIYSGPKDKTGQFGTGFLINKTVRGSIMEYQTVSDKICKIRLKGKFRNITIVSIHAPTEEKSEEIKETFYESLDEVLSQVQKYDQILVIGDFNAQVGSMESQSDVAGKFTVHDYNNNNGDYMAEFAARNKLFIRSTSFQHKKIHLGTWKVRGSNQVNQIDHVLVSKRHISSVLDVRACRGFNCDSDHYLVKAIIREKLSTVQTLKKNKQTKWDTTELKKDVEVRRAYQEALSERLHISPNISVEEKWKLTRTAITNAAEKTVSKQKKGRNMNWYDQECKDLVERKNQARQVMLQRNTRNAKETYKNLRRESKRIMKRKKQENLRREMKEIEDLNKEGETRKFYVAMKKMRNEFQPKISGCRNDRGVVDLDERNTINKWTQYFKELLNPDNVEPLRSETQEHETTPQNRQADDNEEEDAPNITEVKKAIQRLKNNRAPGEDGIVAEMWKAVNVSALEKLESIMKQIWETEILPEEWKTALIHPIHKKGDKSEPNNYRGISLLQVTYKILSKALQNRLEKQVDKEIGEYQGGFRRGRSCVEQISNLKFILRHRKLRGKHTYVTFVDFKKAYDSVDRDTLLNTLEEFGVDTKTIALIKQTLTDTESKVKFSGILSKAFKIKTGLRQGDGISPILFNCVLEKVIREWREKNLKTGIKNIKIGRRKDLEIDCLAFADDLAILSENINDAIEQINNLKEVAEKAGLQISFEKTEYIADVIQAPKQMKTKYGKINRVPKFKYLGEIIQPNGLDKEANKVRARKMENAFQLTRNIYNKKSLSINAKLRHYNTVIKPESLYASECLTLNTAKQLEEIEKKERKIVRRILGPKQENGIWKLKSNKEVYEKTEKIGDTMRKRRVQFYGHLERMDENRLTKQLFDYFDKNPNTKLTWFNETKKDLSEMEIPRDLINERKQFREKIKEFKGYKEREKKKTGAPWTEERKQQHRERMKKYWEEKRRSND
uniref:Craniofacial development protein 2 n=2 Tax=Cacopsylla melanoneura TaxID=428564 RepID=A0A8D8RIQ9_9HEMI